MGFTNRNAYVRLLLRFLCRVTDRNGNILLLFEGSFTKGFIVPESHTSHIYRKPEANSALYLFDHDPWEIVESSQELITS